jgi:hypothetical protein
MFAINSWWDERKEKYPGYTPEQMWRNVFLITFIPIIAIGFLLLLFGF